jgi:hypothetical protein
MKKIFFLCSLISLNSVFLLANSSSDDLKNSKPTIEAVKIDKPIELTGKLDNPLWLKAVPVELNYEVTPGDNTPAPQKTLVRVLYDDKNIYFGFECVDTNPNQIRANVSDRDKIFQDDYVIVCIDTYGDFQKSYEIAVNPFGIQGDLAATMNNEDSSLDWIWFSAASKSEKGWNAEIAIPFSSLNFPNVDEQNWRLNIIRTIPRQSRVQVSWVPIDKNLTSLMPQAGYLKGIKNIHPSGLVELLPYAMGQQAGKLSDNSNPGSGIKYDSFQGRVGGGVKYSPGPEFALDAVINPDFSQIESDAAQISVNTTFALSYTEKRPFFLIGNELLISSVYYSRSINDPLVAARINGKSGSLSYLYMGAYDRNTIFVIPGEEGSNTVGTNLKSFVNIGRLRYDIGDETFIGTQIMTRDLSGGHNYLIGFDWNYKFWSNWYFSGQGYLSQTKELNDVTVLSSNREFGQTGYNASFNGEEYWGNGIHLDLLHGSKNYYFDFGYRNFSPTFQTYNGLLDQVGFNQYSMSHEYDFYPEKSFVDYGALGIGSYLRYDYYGTKREQVIQPYLSLTLKGQTNVQLQYLLVNDESFGGIWFDGINRGSIYINSRPLNEIQLSFNGQLGKFIYRSRSPLMGFGHTLSASLTLKPTPQLNIALSYVRARLSNNQTDELLYDGNIYRAVAIYQFSPEIFFRTIFQYDSFSQAYQVYPLFSYKLNAFTTFFAGVTSDYLNYGDNYGVTNTNQQYFVKVQYLLGM